MRKSTFFISVAIFSLLAYIVILTVSYLMNITEGFLSKSFLTSYGVLIAALAMIVFFFFGRKFSKMKE